MKTAIEIDPNKIAYMKKCIQDQKYLDKAMEELAYEILSMFD